MAKQEAHRGQVASQASHVQRRGVLSLIARVWVRATLQQELDGAHRARAARIVQCRLCHADEFTVVAAHNLRAYPSRACRCVDIALRIEERSRDLVVLNCGRRSHDTHTAARARALTRGILDGNVQRIAFAFVLQPSGGQGLVAC